MSNEDDSLGNPGNARIMIRSCYNNLDFAQIAMIQAELMRLGAELMVTFRDTRKTLGDSLCEYHHGMNSPDMLACVRLSTAGLPVLDGMEMEKTPAFLQIQSSEGRAAVFHPMFTGQRYYLARFYEDVESFKTKGALEGHIKSATLQSMAVYTPENTGAMGTAFMSFLMYGAPDHAKVIARSIYH